MTSAEILHQDDRPEFRLLDKYGRTGGYADALATISAGFIKGDRPVVSRDGTIYLHDEQGRAPYLASVLEKRKKKSLTIAFLHDHLDDIIKQRWAAYSRGSCLWSGDEQSMTVFGAEVKVHQADTPEYAAIMRHKDTKLHYSIYFYLAEWLPNGTAEMVLEDGFAPYRIRTGSRNSARNLEEQYHEIRKHWKGPFKGIPFELTLVNERGNGPDGKKRTFPVFKFTLKPHGGGLRLNSSNFRELVLSGNRAAEGFSLPAPKNPTAEDDAADAVFASTDAKGAPVKADSEARGSVQDEADAEHVSQNAPEDAQLATPEGDVVDAEFTDIDDASLKNLEQNKDPELMKRRWFAAVKGSHLDSGKARAEFLARHIDGITSLSQAVGILNTSNWAEIIIAAEDEIAERKKEDESQAKLAAPQGWHPSVTPAHAKALVDVVRYLGLKRVEVYPFISMVIGAHVHGRGEVTGEHIVTVLKATGTIDGGLEWNYSESKAADLLMDFETWQVNEGALGVL